MDQLYTNGDGGEEYFEASGSLEPLGDNDTTMLFRDLEHELQLLTQRYHVPPDDLSQLFQVVQGMFEVMDTNRDALDRLEAEKNELEDLWKQEKDKLRAAQRRKLELECRLEEERMKIESEKTTLEKDKVSLQTKVKQLGQQKENAEQDLLKIKERTIKEDQIRKDLLEEYKKKADFIKTQSLRRRPTLKSNNRRFLPLAPSIRSPTTSLTTTLRVPSNETLEDSIKSDSSEPQESFPDDTTIKSYHQPSYPPHKTSVQSLEDELAQTSPDLKREEPLSPQNGDGLEESIHSDEERAWSNYQDTEGTSLTDEMMETILSTPMRAEVEMLQREKVMWGEEREKMEQAIKDVRAERESVESLNDQTLVEVRQLRDNLKKMQDEMADVKAERDEILGHYLEQPFDEYCITRKELNDLLKKHQKTAIELEREREEKEKLQKLLASKRSFMERFKERWRKMFTKPLSDEPVLFKSGMELETVRTPSPVPTPLIRSLAAIMDTTLMVEKSWLMSCDSHMAKDTLPQWVGQIILKGMETETINDVAVGRVYHSPIQLFPGSMTPPRMRVGGRHSSNIAMKVLAGLQQLHAEIWVATTESSMAYIEIIDVLARPSKVRQRFVVRPKSKMILCMRSIPGVVEESQDFIDSTHDTAWVESSFLGSQQTDFTQSMIVKGASKKRPRSAPQRRQTFGGDFMSSSPDLSSCSEPGPLELFTSRSAQPQAPASKSQLEIVTSSETYTNSLSTINELDRTSTHPPPIIVTSEDRQNDGQQRSLLVTCEEDVDFDNSDPNISISSASTEDQRSKVTSTPISTPRSKQPLPISPLHQSNSKPSIQDMESPLVKSGSNVPSTDTEVTDGRTEHRGEKDPVMWIVTDNNTLYFYPTTHPSHKPFNSVQLHTKAVCMEYIRGKVFMGHSDSTLSVYYMDEFSHMWDVENPERISLPSPNINEVYEVQCIAAVSDRIWVGAGPSIFFLDVELPASREGSIFLDSWRRKPRQILPLGDIVVVTTSSTCLYLFDAISTHLIQKININSIAKLLDHPTVSNPHNTTMTSHTTSTIKKVVSDDTNLYIGTSSGKMVAVPISSLRNLRDRTVDRSDLTSPVDFSLPHSVSVSLSPTHGATSPTHRITSPTHKPGSPLGSPCGSPKSDHVSDETDGFLDRKKEKKRQKKKKTKIPKEEVKNVKTTIDEQWEELRTAEEEDVDGPYLENTAISLHSLNDSEVLRLVHLCLPDNQISKLKAPSDPVPYHSMPNLSSPFGGRVPISPPIVTYKTIILAMGKGHMEYIVDEDPEAIEESVQSAIRERNESFQLLAWGHKNVLP